MISHLHEHRFHVRKPKFLVPRALKGIEAEGPLRDPFSFECPNCGKIEARGLLVALPDEPK